MALIWSAFLTDQRGPRKSQGVMNSRSLRTVTESNLKIQEAKDMVRYKMEDLRREEKAMEKEDAVIQTWTTCRPTPSCS